MSRAADPPTQVLRELKSQSQIRVLDDLIRLAPKLLSQIMHMTGVDIPKNSHVAARVLLKFGVGISGGVCLGWADTKGFHMVGCRGQVSAAASIGADIMAGLHHTRRCGLDHSLPQVGRVWGAFSTGAQQRRAVRQRGLEWWRAGCEVKIGFSAQPKGKGWNGISAQASEDR